MHSGKKKKEKTSQLERKSKPAVTHRWHGHLSRKSIQKATRNSEFDRDAGWDQYAKNKRNEKNNYTSNGYGEIDI